MMPPKPMIKLIQLRRAFHHDRGAAYTAALDYQPTKSDQFFLIEDGASIGVGDALHEDIRNDGKGRFSVWKDVVYFSASDNSDCNKNRRNYQLAVLDLDSGDLINRFAQNDEAMLRANAANMSHNNSFMTNFCQYYNMISSCLVENGIPKPVNILEIGSGARPFTGLRFLLEGAERYVANDLFEVQRTFSPAFVHALRLFCQSNIMSAWWRIDSVFKQENDAYCVPALQAVGGRSFTSLDELGTFDLIHSTSVLEHVQEPERVAHKMAECLRPGGYMFHSIDFRDHRDFSKPYAFLSMSESEYAPIATENRLRLSDWLVLLDKAGFEIVERHDWAMAPESVRAGHKVAHAAFKYFRPGEPILPLVTEDMREEFADPFKGKDLVDLSVLCTRLLCRLRAT
jgi:SAM-dependent methyltransferase